MKWISLGLFLLSLGLLYFAARFGAVRGGSGSGFWFSVFLSAAWFVMLSGLVLVFVWAGV